VKYRKDTRYSEEAMSTHDKQMFQARPAEKLSEVSLCTDSVEVIGIDEGQFFPDLVEHCETWANQGKIVIVAALDGTFQKQPFGDVLKLVPLAENVCKLNAVCMVCFKDAAFTKRLGSETQVELIGGSDLYISVCRTCFDEHNTRQNIRPYQSSPKKQKSSLSGSNSTTTTTNNSKNLFSSLAVPDVVVTTATTATTDNDANNALDTEDMNMAGRIFSQYSCSDLSD